MLTTLPTLPMPALGEHECETLADCLPSAGMSAVDQVTRAIGHAYEYETDEMGAAASVVRLTETERYAYVVAAWADSAKWSAYESELLGRPTRERTYRVGDDGWKVPGEWSYVRSDDRGFWDAIECASESEARGYLAEWVAQNVPPHCEGCGETIDPDDDGGEGFCTDCEAMGWPLPSTPPHA